MNDNWKGGGIPYGYHYDTIIKDLVLDEYESFVIKKIFDLVTEGLGPNLIANELNMQNLKGRRGKKWSANTIFKLLSPARLKFYRGFDKNGLRGSWKELLSEGCYREILEKRAVHKSDKPKNELRTKEKYLLSNIGILYCGYCGGKVKASVTGKGNLKKKYYYCSTRQTLGESTCNRSKLIHMESVNQIVISDLRSRTTTNYLSYISDFTDFTKKDKLKKILYMIEEIHQYMVMYLHADPQQTMKTYSDSIKVIDEVWNEFHSIGTPALSPEYSDQDFIIKNISKIVLVNDSIKIIYKFPILYKNIFEVSLNLES